MQQYTELALRTLVSGTFNPDKVPAAELTDIMVDVQQITEVTDRLKKALIYGKDMGEFEGDDATEMFAHLNPDLVHGILGLFTEAGELMVALSQAVFNKTPIDMVNLREEFGDTMWYQAVISHVAGFTFEEAGLTNIAKLAKRYPERFTPELALNRDIAAERQILENEVGA